MMRFLFFFKKSTKGYENIAVKQSEDDDEKKVGLTKLQVLNYSCNCKSLLL